MILKVNPDSPEPDKIKIAADMLISGKLVVFPTETVYGLGAHACDKAALARVYEVKKRPDNMPFPVMASEAQIRELCTVPEIASPFFDRRDLFITAILPARDSAPVGIVHHGTMALRFPCSELTRSIVENVGPITSTSANIHGGLPPTNIAEALGQLGENISIYIDSGTLPGIPSTIIDFTGTKPKVIREGAISSEEVANIYG